jgi:hypothetical protein
MKLLSYQTHRKIYYPAGIISLVLLPALCIWWLYQHKAFEPLRAMDIAFVDPVPSKDSPSAFTLPLNKKYVVFELTGNNAEDSLSLNYAQLMLKRWKIAKDDTHAIDIHFGKKAKYWTLIEAVNKVKAIGLDIYIPYQDHFYAFWNFHPIRETVSVPRMPCGTLSFGIVLDNPERHEWGFKKIIANFQNLLKDYWVPFIVFTVMIILTFRRVKHIAWLNART